MHLTSYSVLAFLLLGCSNPEPQGLHRFGLFMYDLQAEEVLKSMGVHRRVSRAVFHPMALNRLVVDIESLNPGVRDLSIVLVDAGRGWELEWPSRAAISAWSRRSSGK